MLDTQIVLEGDELRLAHDQPVKHRLQLAVVTVLQLSEDPTDAKGDQLDLILDVMQGHLCPIGPVFRPQCRAVEAVFFLACLGIGCPDRRRVPVASRPPVMSTFMQPTTSVSIGAVATRPAGLRGSAAP